MPCPHCYVGLCKKHKLQDHGEREKKLLASRQVLQKKMIEESVKPHAARILAQGKGTSEKELDKYREVRAQNDTPENHTHAIGRLGT